LSYWRPAGAVTHRHQRVVHWLLLQTSPEPPPLLSAGYWRPAGAVTHRHQRVVHWLLLQTSPEPPPLLSAGFELGVDRQRSECDR